MAEAEHATTALSSVGDQVENLRASFAQKATGSRFVLTALFQACSIRLSAAPTEEKSCMTSADDVMVFSIYHH